MEEHIMRWKYREKYIAKIIPPNSDVLDLGGGEGWLPSLVSLKSYKIMDRNTERKNIIFADFNKDVYPEVDGKHLVTAFGLLEYIDDIPLFLEKIKKYGDNLIFTYYQKEIPASGWHNNYNYVDILNMVKDSGWILMCTYPVKNTGELIFVCKI